MIYLNTDGGARGNPGPSAIAFVISNDSAVIKEGGSLIGEATNNTAEYSALILGLKELINLGERIVTCRLDSELVVKQLNKEYKVKDAKMAKLFAEIKELEKNFTALKFVHVPRKDNSRADKLVNEFLDGKRKS